MKQDFEQIRKEAIAAGYGAVWTPPDFHLLEEWAPDDSWHLFELDSERHQLHVGAMRSGAMVRGVVSLVRASEPLVAELSRAIAQANARPHAASARPDHPDAAAPGESGWLFKPPSKIGAIGL